MPPKSTPTPDTSQSARAQATFASQKRNSRGRNRIYGPYFRKNTGRVDTLRTTTPHPSPPFFTLCAHVRPTDAQALFVPPVQVVLHRVRGKCTWKEHEASIRSAMGTGAGKETTAQSQGCEPGEREARRGSGSTPACPPHPLLMLIAALGLDSRWWARSGAKGVLATEQDEQRRGGGGGKGRGRNGRKGRRRARITRCLIGK
ncbi:hypothetical protein B0H13DRAFT_2293477 [Mycena leptocephala]|nr:hypothetical protein B0H13DRAFT_2293477 [Mycena leptocephala]